MLKGLEDNIMANVVNKPTPSPYDAANQQWTQAMATRDAGLQQQLKGIQQQGSVAQRRAAEMNARMGRSVGGGFGTATALANIGTQQATSQAIGDAARRNQQLQMERLAQLEQRGLSQEQLQAQQAMQQAGFGQQTAMQERGITEQQRAQQAAFGQQTGMQQAQFGQQAGMQQSAQQFQAQQADLTRQIQQAQMQGNWTLARDLQNQQSQLQLQMQQAGFGQQRDVLGQQQQFQATQADLNRQLQEALATGQIDLARELQEKQSQLQIQMQQAGFGQQRDILGLQQQFQAQQNDLTRQLQQAQMEGNWELARDLQNQRDQLALQMQQGLFGHDVGMFGIKAEYGREMDEMALLRELAATGQLDPSFLEDIFGTGSIATPLSSGALSSGFDYTTGEMGIPPSIGSVYTGAPPAIEPSAYTVDPIGFSRDIPTIGPIIPTPVDASTTALKNLP
jgi:hypothetical protein